MSQSRKVQATEEDDKELDKALESEIVEDMAEEMGAEDEYDTDIPKPKKKSHLIVDLFKYRRHLRPRRGRPKFKQSKYK